MGRSKPRTNKRPPPKPKASSAAPPRLPGVEAAEEMFSAFPTLASPSLASAMGLGAMGVNASLDPTDPNFPSAFQSWSTSALSQLGQLPSLTPSQLSVIAGAAAGVVDAGLRANGHAPPLGAGNGQNVSMLPNLPPSGQGLPIDLPASLAALFEAKLTLDREKAKLMRMQKELKGYREGVAAVNLKGKQVAVQDPEDLGECTCGRNGHTHDYPGSAHSGSDEYYYYDTEDEECCDCCSHDHEHDHLHEHDHGHPDEAEYDECHHHHHHEHDHAHHEHEHGHTHTHEGEVDSDPDEYERHAAHADALERQRLERHAERLRHAQQHAQFDRTERGRLEPNAYAAAMSVAERLAFEKHNLAQAQAQAQQQAQPSQNRQPQQSGERGGVGGGDAGKGDGRAGGGEGRKRLVDDPERMDEAVRELFNWIKAVVWTIEQAAIVAGRRGWAAEAK